MGRSPRVILDPDDIVLAGSATMEVDDTDPPLVSTTTVTGDDLAGGVAAAAFTTERDGEFLDGAAFVEVGVVGEDDVPQGLWSSVFSRGAGGGGGNGGLTGMKGKPGPVYLFRIAPSSFFVGGGPPNIICCFSSAFGVSVEYSRGARRAAGTWRRESARAAERAGRCRAGMAGRGEGGDMRIKSERNTCTPPDFPLSTFHTKTHVQAMWQAAVTASLLFIYSSSPPAVNY